MAKTLQEIFGTQPTQKQNNQQTKSNTQKLQSIFSDKQQVSTPVAQQSQPDNQTKQPVSKQLNLSKPEQVAVGAGKGVISTLTSASSLGEKIIKGIGRTLTPKKYEEQLGFAKTEKTGAEELIPEELRTPETGAEKVGFIGEQILEFFIPGAAGLKAGKAAQVGAKAAGAGKTLQTAAKLGAISATEAGLAAGQTALQTGEFGKEAKTAGALGAIFPLGFAGAAAAAKPLTKGLGKFSAAALGKATGTSADTIIESFKNPNVVKFAREAGKDVASFTDDIFESVKSGLNQLVRNRAKAYQSQLSKIKLNKTQLDDLTRGVRNKATDLLEQFDITVVPPGQRLEGNILDFSNSTIIKGQDAVERAFNDVMRWTDNSPVGLDKLKRRLYAFEGQLTRENKQAKLIIKDLARSVDQGLKDTVKGYEKMTRGWRQATETINDIEKTLSIGDKKAKETGLKKILAALRTNNEQRKEMLKLLDPTGKKDIIGKVAGAQLSERASRGLSGALFPLGGGIVSALNPSAIPAILGYIAISSPRFVAELTNILGKVTNQMIKTNKFTPEIQRALRELIIKIKKDNS